MNVFLRELRSNRKGLIFWCIGMIFLVGSGVAKFYGYSTTGQSTIAGVYEMFPHSLQVLFGLNGFDLTKPGGVYGILFMYIVLTAVIHAVLRGTDLISKEERDKTSEFLFAKPVSRNSVVTEKLLAGLFSLIVLNLVTLVSSIYVVDYFSKSTAGTSDVLLLSGALFILQLLFFLVGAAIAAVSKQPKAAAGIATAVVLVTFIMYFMINLNEHIDTLKYFTPFKYFEAKDLIASGSLDMLYVALSGGIIAIALVATYVTYSRRDLTT
ncbi:MAG: ABC transporter permease subunit [Candidatus Saccharibacteria bacterium]